MGVRRTPTFATCTLQEVKKQFTLQGTTAGRAAEITQFTFGFNTWKFCFLYSLLLQFVCA